CRRAVRPRGSESVPPLSRPGSADWATAETDWPTRNTTGPPRTYQTKSRLIPSCLVRCPDAVAAIAQPTPAYQPFRLGQNQTRPVMPLRLENLGVQRQAPALYMLERWSSRPYFGSCHRARDADAAPRPNHVPRWKAYRVRIR